MPTFNPSNLQPFAPQGLGGILRSAALLFFAYTGYARLATLGEEVREPRKTIPRAILLALGIAALLYGAVALVAVGNIGAPAMAASRSPIQAAAAAFNWPQIMVVVGVGASTAMLGVLLSQILGISRMVYAMARRGDLARFFEHVDERHGVPDRGILLTALAMLLVVLFGTLELIVSAASFTILVYYSITNLAALRMPKAHRLYPLWVSILGLIACIILAFTLQPAVILSGLGLLALGLLLRFFFRKQANPEPNAGADNHHN